MHLNCHLAECIEDYGPIFGFWLFSFERYNGMLGKFPNNQKHIEVQLMRRFETELQLYALPLPRSFSEAFSNLLKPTTNDTEMIDNHYMFYQLANGCLREDAIDVMLLFKGTGTWKFPKRWTVHHLNTSELIAISQVLRHIFVTPGFIPEIQSLPKLLRFYKHVEFRSEIFSIYNDSRYGRHSHILALWAGENDLDLTSHQLRPGQIEQILQYKFTPCDGEVRSLAMAKVKWYKSHPQKCMFGTGLQLWDRNNFEDFGRASYIPIHCIRSKFAPAYGSIDVSTQAASMPTVDHESVLFICPLRPKF